MNIFIKGILGILLIIFGAIIGDIIGVIDIPLKEHIKIYFTPTKVFTIYQSSAQFINETKTLKLLDNLDDISSIIFFQGCGRGDLQFLHNLNGFLYLGISL